MIVSRLSPEVRQKYSLVLFILILACLGLTAIFLIILGNRTSEFRDYPIDIQELVPKIKNGTQMFEVELSWRHKSAMDAIYCFFAFNVILFLVLLTYVLRAWRLIGPGFFKNRYHELNWKTFYDFLKRLTINFRKFRKDLVTILGGKIIIEAIFSLILLILLADLLNSANSGTNKVILIKNHDAINAMICLFALKLVCVLTEGIFQYSYVQAMHSSDTITPILLVENENYEDGENRRVRIPSRRAYPSSPEVMDANQAMFSLQNDE